MNMPRLEDYLHENGVPFRTTHHQRAITAQEVAAEAHIRGREMAKPVMVMLDEQLVMVVLPADERLHLGRLRQATGASEARLASEWEFMHRFPECETGAMPPFGNLYGLRVLVADSLAEDETIAFNAGNHTDLMIIAYRDFRRLVRPEMVSLHGPH
ncbi:MAG: deacylase [Gammaproteobacteria bacterium HGW-Gammaproteobacteria-4]|jgi:Ala-tRNA(Pro) deacylase|nr:MAG: deacylase [Gammaproteobacteria bacterium HGW-Gammaproteobacteria-4]